MLGNFFMFLLSSVHFLQNELYQNNLSGTLSMTRLSSSLDEDQDRHSVDPECRSSSASNLFVKVISADNHSQCLSKES